MHFNEGNQVIHNVLLQPKGFTRVSQAVFKLSL